MSSNPHGITAAPLLDEAQLEALGVRLAYARDQAHISPAWLDFRQAILTAQRTVIEGFRVPQPPLRLPVNAGGPLLDLLALPLPAGPIEELWHALVTATRTLGRPSPALDAIDAVVAEHPSMLAELAFAIMDPEPLALEALARRFGAPQQAIAFVGRTLAAPFLAQAARRVSQYHIDASGRPGSRCPFCHSPASLAVLSRAGEGKRHLCCGLCGASWHYPRIRCPSCETSDQDQLGFLETDHEAQAWVEVCQACRAAIKTVDERRLPKGATVLPVAEDILSLHLDLLARREGYTPAPDWVAGA
jgi:FdhE protein